MNPVPELFRALLYPTDGVVKRMRSRNLNIISFLLAWRNILSAHGEHASFRRCSMSLPAKIARGDDIRHGETSNRLVCWDLGRAVFVDTITESMAEVFQPVANP
jgi:hypothetical protein